jgi:hypothetical protein
MSDIDLNDYGIEFLYEFLVMSGGLSPKMPVPVYC